MILVSSCLAGINCRFDGRSKPNEYVINLVKRGLAIPVCPEELGGLSTPREPCEPYNKKIITQSGIDLTEKFKEGAKKALDIALANECKVAILRIKSPSCGCGLIPDGTFSNKLIEGDGILTKLLKENNIRVYTEKNYIMKH
jgi:uncharacterized protein YbbK (DUF523 family)